MMSICRLVFRRLWCDQSGIAALEFAIVAPIMAVILLGTIEISNAIRLQARLNVVAGQLAEYIAGSNAITLGAASSMSGNEMTSLSDMCAGAAMSLYPFNLANLAVSVGSDTDGTQPQYNYVHPITDWTTDTYGCSPTSTYHYGQGLFGLSNSPLSLYTKEGTPYGSGGTAIMGYSGINVWVFYIYNNAVPSFLQRVIYFSASAVARPRANKMVTCTSGGSTCPPNP